MRPATSLMLLSAMLAASASSVAQTAAPAQPATSHQPPQATPAKEHGGARDAVDRIKDVSIARRDEALAQARKSTEAIDRDIARLQADARDRWQALDKDARDRTQTALADLRERRTRLAEWYGGMQHGSDAAWEEVKTGFVSSYHTLAESFRRARTQFDANRAPPAKPPASEKDKKQ